MSTVDISNPSALVQFALGLNSKVEISNWTYEDKKKLPATVNNTKYLCRTCKKEFIKKSALKYHLKTHWLVIFLTLHDTKLVCL